MKLKGEGVALLVSLGISFLALGISLAVINSIRQSAEQNANLERAAQVFFTAESGMEAAFFHHNARGQGVSFIEDPVGDSQKIAHLSNSSSVEWRISGRATPTIGILKEGEAVQIPLYWDKSENPADAPPVDGDGNFDPGDMNAGEFPGPFVLKFYTGVQDGGDDLTQALYDTYGPFELPGNFDFGSVENEVLIDWSLSKKDEVSLASVTFVPKTGVTACEDADSKLLCEDDYLTEILISSGDGGLVGTILPGNDTTNLNAFRGGGEVFMLSFRPLLPFYSTEGTPETDDDVRILGIPFSIDTSDEELPRSSYTVTTEVNVGNYQKTITAVVPENVSIGAFDYVIFD